MKSRRVPSKVRCGRGLALVKTWVGVWPAILGARILACTPTNMPTNLLSFCQRAIFCAIFGRRQTAFGKYGLQISAEILLDRMGLNVIELDFSFGFWKEHGDY